MKVEWISTKTINEKMLWEFIVLENNDPGAIGKKICLTFDHSTNGYSMFIDDYMMNDLINVYFSENKSKKNKS